MIVDGRTLPNGEVLETDLCIVGAGPAGIALAREFAGEPVRVLVLESGGLAAEDRPHPLNVAENVGAHPVDLTSRRRGLGGATVRWGGNSMWFDPIDFELREHLPDTEWPFPHSEIAGYYPRAARLLGLGGKEFDADRLAATDPEFARRRLPFDPDRLVTKPVWRWPLRFGPTHRDIFATETGNLVLATNLTVVGMASPIADHRVGQATALTPDRKKVHVRAKAFVLAAGIETVRLLLAMQRGLPEPGLPGLHAGHGALGAYFMAHINMPWGILVPAQRQQDLRLYTLEPEAPVDRLTAPVLHAALQMAPEFQRSARTLNHVAFLVTLSRRPLNLTPEVLAFGRRLRRRLAGGRAGPFGRLVGRHLGPRLYAIRHFMEQAPIRDRALTLGTETDALGLPRLRINWRVARPETWTIEVALKNLAHQFRRSGLGRVVWTLPGRDAEWPPHLAHASHFIGGARMHADPKMGVVDADGRIHGFENLFVAGAAVMPSSGANMVTCNLLALTLRLADHLKAIHFGRA